MDKRQTFSKDERLCKTKLIEEIFEHGSVFHSPHFRVLWIISPVKLPVPAQIAISVPKKIFRHAVTRNLVKRRIREAYRKNKQLLYDCLEPENVQIVFLVVVRQNTVPDYLTVEKSVKEALESLCGAVRKMH